MVTAERGSRKEGRKELLKPLDTATGSAAGYGYGSRLHGLGASGLAGRAEGLGGLRGVRAAAAGKGSAATGAERVARGPELLEAGAGEGAGRAGAGAGGIGAVAAGARAAGAEADRLRSQNRKLKEMQFGRRSERKRCRKRGGVGPAGESEGVGSLFISAKFGRRVGERRACFSVRE